jgi:hypothetical protein
MKYAKTLGLATIAAAALMAFMGAGAASAASVLCSTQTAPCSSKWAEGTNLTFSQSTSILLKETGSQGETLDTCKNSSIESLMSNGTSTSNAIGAFFWNWFACTWTTTTITSADLEISSAFAHNGLVKARFEPKVTISIPFFGSCVYGVASGTTLGTITEGKPATFDFNAVAQKWSGSSITCPETANWSGSYTQTTPSNTTLSVESS